MTRTPEIDIVAFLQAAEKWTGDELSLDELQLGDQVLVSTKNTKYLFRMTGKGTADLTTDRADRPSGSVRIQGCVFNDSRMIKPGHLFCGGGMELAVSGEPVNYVTTAIRAISLLRIDRAA